MRDTTKHCIINGILVLFGFVSLSMITDTARAENAIKPPKIEMPATTREEIVTGVCSFGCRPVTVKATGKTEPTTAAIPTLPPTTATTTAATIKQTEIPTAEKITIEAETATPTEPATEAVTESAKKNGYIGRMYITGYTAEEGFPEGSATASGYGVRPGYCALNAEQRRSLGISYGDQIYVDGLGTYTVMDCGCGWGVVDIWVYTNAEAYSITGGYDVYLV